MIKKICKFTAMLFLLACPFCLVACTKSEKDPFEDATDITLMSFNIRVGEQTEIRRAAVSKNIRDISPDVFGVQEANPAWISYLKEDFSDYTMVGEGRDGGEKGEYAAIFYRTEDYTLLQGGTKWLSLTPDTPSRLAGSSNYNRILTYAKLQDNSTGAIFVYINAHLDHSNERDAIASMQMNIVTEFAKNFDGYPIFIAGDFNQKPESKTYAAIANAGYLDSALVANESHNTLTFHGYGNTKDPRRIDYCFITEDNIRLSKYDTWDKLAENGGHNGYISDHYAIYVKGCFINSTAASTTENKLNNTIFKCGDKFYGDVSFNTYVENGISCAYSDNTVTFTVDSGKELVLPGLETAENIGVHITGGGSVVFNGDVSVNSLKTTGTVNVTINGNLSAESTDFGVDTNIQKN